MAWITTGMCRCIVIQNYVCMTLNKCNKLGNKLVALYSLKGPITMLGVDRLNCCWSSPAQPFLASSLVETYDEVFCSLLDMYVFRGGAYSSTRGGGRCICAGAMFVSLLCNLTAYKLLLFLANTLKYGKESRGTRYQESLGCRRPAAI
jgi:hypothetical protein